MPVSSLESFGTMRPRDRLGGSELGELGMALLFIGFYMGFVWVFYRFYMVFYGFYLCYYMGFL